jgi:RimJ/RimL family protein N-acetyltransferase
MPDELSVGAVFAITGEQVALGPLRRDLLPLYQRWWNDFTTMRNMGDVLQPSTAERVAAWFDRRAASEDGIAFLIYERAARRPIGIAQLQDVDQRNRTAEYVVAISEADARGKGYGTEATRLMLTHAFKTLGLHSVYLSVFEYNPAGKRAYQKAGFRVCGQRRAAIYLNSRHWDEFIMECLAAEFDAGSGGAGD